MRRTVAIYILLMVGVLPLPLRAQSDPSFLQKQIQFRHLTITEGLSQGDITSIDQDSLGFIWLGTEDGLNRFDGHRIRVFKPLAFDTTSLSHPWIVGVEPDEGSDLWVATEGGGLNRYRATTESFEHIRFEDLDRVSDGLFTLIKTRSGGLWIGTRYDGLIYYEPRTHHVVTYRHDPGDPKSLSDDRITALLEDTRGRIWIGTGDGGLNRFDPDTGSWTIYRHDPDAPASLPGDHVTALLEDREGSIWIGMSPGGLSRYRPDTDRLIHYRHEPRNEHTLGNNHVLALFEDPRGTLWVGTGNSLDRMDRATGHFTHYRHDPADPRSLRQGAVRALFLDRTGVFWAGTSGGASYFIWDPPPFQHITTRPGDPNSLDNRDVWSLYEDRAGMLWVGTSTGLNRVDRRKGIVTRYPVNPGDPAALVSGGVMGLYEDRQGTFWVGTRFGALHRFDRATGSVVERFIEDPFDPTSLKNDTPWDFFEDSKGRFWITAGGRGCLSQMDRETRTFQHFCHNPEDPNTPSHDIAHDLIESRSGWFWLGTWGGGLNRFDPETSTFTTYRHNPTDPDTPASDFILALHQDSEGILWLGLYGAGLDRFDPETGTFTHFTEANSELPNDIVLSIEEDKAGDLWMSTYRGLARLSPATGDSEGARFRLRSYGIEDGLQDLEFNSKTSFRSSSGELFFGGINGVTAFFPERIHDNPVPPPVVLTDLRIRGNPIGIGRSSPLQKALPFTRTLTLKHDERDVAITFAALHFTDPAGNRYRYRLDGYDEAWIQPGSGHTATYTNLDPGRYSFQVQAANSDGVWNEKGAVLEIIVRRPPWQTVWAYLFYTLLVIALLYGFRRYELNRLRLKNRLAIEQLEAEQLRELDRAKSRFFANVSHEFRTPLTLTLGPLDDLHAGLYGPLSLMMNEQVDLARRNARRVLDLINQILELARLEAGRMPLHVRPVDLGAFVWHLTRAFMPLAERKSITLSVVVPPDLLLVYADPEHLEKALSNLLSNAFKFTPAGGAVGVSVGTGPQTALIVVHDNGPGIPADELASIFERFHRVNESSRLQPGTGIGLGLAKELVELHGGTLTVESREGSGSLFTITLRQGSSHLLPEQIMDHGETGPWTPDEMVSLPATTPESGELLPEEETDQDDVTTVLVVEDHAEVRAYLRRHLVPDYRVIEAADGEQGLVKARTFLPDLVLSDVMMPGRDGYDLCHALKTDPETDFIPVILLTARAAQEDRLEGLQHRADDYLTKPFDLTELRARIENLIDSRKRLRERFLREGMALVPGLDRLPTELHPSPVDMVSADAVFLGRVREVVDAHLSDESFSVECLADEVGLSRGHLHRQLRSLLDVTPSDVIRTMRMERAAQLLEVRAGTVSEVAYAVGFKSVAHFSNAFDRHYGCRPSAYPVGKT